MRNAIDLYITEHIGQPPPSVAEFAAVMTGTTDLNHGSPGIYGPYLRAIPPLPIGTQKGTNSVVVAPPGTVAGGWAYDPGTGEIFANLPDGEADAGGVDYNDY